MAERKTLLLLSLRLLKNQKGVSMKESIRIEKMRRPNFKLETAMGISMIIYHCKMCKGENLLPVDVIETSTMIYVYETNPQEYGYIEPLMVYRRPY